MLAQAVRSGQTRNSRTNDSNFHSDSQSANAQQALCVGLIRSLLYVDKNNFVLDNLKNHDFVHDHACSGFTPFLSALPGGCRINAPPIPSSETGLPIAAVERETGLAKDTLACMEKRYGFPQPLRDASGNRLYPAEQVQRLQLVRRLLDAGLRPNKVVGLDAAALTQLLSQHSQASSAILSKTNSTPLPSHPAELSALLDTIAAHDPQGLRHALHHAQMRMGLGPFITELVAPLDGGRGRGVGAGAV